MYFVNNIIAEVSENTEENSNRIIRFQIFIFKEIVLSETLL